MNKAYEKFVQENGEEPLLPDTLFNQKQLFFINLAQSWCTKSTTEHKIFELRDPHSPGRFR